MNRSLITIIGKPNVGKSTLFNRIIGEKKSIVSPVEGVTRDRVYSSYDWLGRIYDIIDTGGFVLNENDINRYLNLELDGSNFLKEIKKTDLEFLDIIPSSAQLVGAEVELVSMFSREKTLKDAIEKFQTELFRLFF